MVTVITTKEELPTPVNNGATGTESSDNERPTHSMKDFQEVDLHQTASCRPLPEDLFDKTTGHILKASIKGPFYMQIDKIEPFMQNEQSFLLTITDGFATVHAVTIGHIQNLNLKCKSGSKLLLNNVIYIKDGLLQLTHDNTRFQHGSSTYPRPRRIHRNRQTGGNRSSNDGRYNKRYENDDNNIRVLKRQPPKTTLMDFMTSLKISKENDNPKRETDHHSRSSLNNNNSNDESTIQQDAIDEQLDVDDDPSHATYRERRNPLPPRLQRAQEERSRRTNIRYYEETIMTNETNNMYGNDLPNNQSLSSLSSAYPRSTSSLNSYGQPTNIFPNINSSTPTHMTYYSANPNLTYPIAGIPSPPYANHQALMSSGYPSDPMAYCYGPPYGAPSYVPTASGNCVNGDLKINGNGNSDNENINTQSDECNDSGIKCETSSNEQKQTPPSSLNDSQTIVQDEKHRDYHTNPKHRWKVGEACLARWSEDGQFYNAIITKIQSPICVVWFYDYNSYEEVRFHDLKMIPYDTQYFSWVPPPMDYNLNPYYGARQNYYPITMDGCLMMPEVPPFPFNSSGTVYMYPQSVTSTTRSNRTYFNSSQSTRRNENNGADLTLNSTSPSKDSNDTSAIDSTTTSSNDDNQQHDSLLPQICSLDNKPLNSIVSDEPREHSTNTESSPANSKSVQQQEAEKEEETKE